MIFNNFMLTCYKFPNRYKQFNKIVKSTTVIRKQTQTCIKQLNAVTHRGTVCRREGGDLGRVACGVQNFGQRWSPYSRFVSLHETLVLCCN